LSIRVIEGDFSFAWNPRRNGACVAIFEKNLLFSTLGTLGAFSGLELGARVSH
jgi:hypothetical protein